MFIGPFWRKFIKLIKTIFFYHFICYLWVIKKTTNTVTSLTKGRNSKRKRRGNLGWFWVLLKAVSYVCCRFTITSYSRRKNVRSVIKMTTYLLMQRSLKQQRIFQNRTQPFDSLNDSHLISRYCFPRRVILDMIDTFDQQLRPYTNKSHAISTQLQVFFLSKHWNWEHPMATGVFERKHFMPGIQILTKVVVDIKIYFYK